MVFQEVLHDLEKKGLRRHPKQVESAQGARVVIQGKTLLNFCSNDYLGLANDSRLKDAAAQCMAQEGWGAGASRLVCGNMGAHARLERALAAFKGAEACLVFSTGYMANVGIISGLFSRDDIIFSDRLNHASIIDGILLSGAKMKRYPHTDMPALQKMLEDSPATARKVIVTDTVFSMDGDIAPLDKIVALAQRYGCLVMADEAHAFGVLGKNGKGAVEHFGLEGKIDIQMGTLSKAVGSFGAYCCGSRDLIELLMNRARSFIYTTGMPPSVAAASLAGVQIIQTEAFRREALGEKARYVLSELKAMGFETLQSQTPIIPIVVGESERSVLFSQKLFEKGIFIPAIRPPTVPAHTARLRVTVTAAHSEEDLNYLLEHLKQIGKDLCLI